MSIKVNGEEYALDGPVTVSGLLKKHKVEMPEMVSVQLNGQFVEKGDYQNTVVKDNDEIDFLYYMGGG